MAASARRGRACRGGRASNAVAGVKRRWTPTSPARNASLSPRAAHGDVLGGPIADAGSSRRRATAWSRSRRGSKSRSSALTAAARPGASAVSCRAGPAFGLESIRAGEGVGEAGVIGARHRDRPCRGRRRSRDGEPRRGLHRDLLAEHRPDGDLESVPGAPAPQARPGGDQRREAVSADSAVGDRAGSRSRSNMRRTRAMISGKAGSAAESAPRPAARLSRLHANESDSR